ncbi:MAG TPA: hypothetical protein VNF73_07670 [Candidatus Saccharimonadales bacterium]|nr:hypothetical protein [Candidatus Saccharimonadales bacterium]
MSYAEQLIHQSLSDRLAQMYGYQVVTRTLRDLAIDLVGADESLGMPANCRAWLDDAIAQAAGDAADRALDALFADLARSLSTAPDDVGQCELLQTVIRAQSIHVLEVR